jgi:hypothetical protein
MCLYIDNIGAPKVAKRSIRVYKVIGKGKDVLFTPYFSRRINLGRVYGSWLDAPNTDGIVRKGIHSFRYLHDATELATNITNSTPCCCMIVVKCYIPKGSNYYSGTFEICTVDHSDKYSCYASDKIKYSTEVLYEKELYSTVLV